MMGLRPLAGYALGAHVSPRRVGQRAPRAHKRGPNSSSQHAAEIIYVAMVELETEAAVHFSQLGTVMLELRQLQ